MRGGGGGGGHVIGANVKSLGDVGQICNINCMTCKSA